MSVLSIRLSSWSPITMSCDHSLRNPHPLRLIHGLRHQPSSVFKTTDFAWKSTLFVLSDDIFPSDHPRSAAPQINPRLPVWAQHPSIALCCTALSHSDTTQRDTEVEHRHGQNFPTLSSFVPPLLHANAYSEGCADNRLRIVHREALRLQRLYAARCSVWEISRSRDLRDEGI